MVARKSIQKYLWFSVVAVAISGGLVGLVHAVGPITSADIEPDFNAGGFLLNGVTDEVVARTGESLGAIGDMNGDGFDDFIAGAWAVDNPGNIDGQSYVVFGKANGARVTAEGIVSGNGGFVIDGFGGGASGIAVAGAGDVNGDGIPDVIIGAPNIDVSPGFFNGQAYVVFGKSSGSAVALSDVVGGMGGFSIDSHFSLFDAGTSVDGIGDMNGDGFDDVIVGVPGSNRAHVVFGKSGGTSIALTDIESGTGGFLISGLGITGSIGFRVAGVGDVNGDGIPDVAVAAFDAEPNTVSNSGETYIIFGKSDTTTVALTDIQNGMGGFNIEGADDADFSGGDVAGAGDVNGDGLADIVIGATGADPNALSLAGSAYVVFGKTNTATVALSDVELSMGGFVINGRSAGDRAGFGVGGAGDMNGDGLDDVLVGAPEALLSGESFVVYGNVGGTAVELSDVFTGNGGFVFGTDATSPNIFSDLGTAMAGAIDLNGDGNPDFIAGAPFASVVGISGDQGRVWAVYNPVNLTGASLYTGKSRPGDGAGGEVVPPTIVRNARVTIDYSDDDSADDGSGGASTENVTLTRSNAGISNLVLPAANVAWEITTNRTGFSSADLTFRYTTAEIAGLDENTLTLYTASSPAGPWLELTATLDTGRNEITANVTGFSFFAIGGEVLSLPMDWKGTMVAMLLTGVLALSFGHARRRRSIDPVR